FHEGFPDASRDEVNGCEWLHQVYSLAKPDYTGTCTVPTLWDRKTKTIVNNESSEIIRMFNSAFDGVGAKPGDYYPAPLRGEADWRLFPTLVRFDAAYHHVFKCTWRPISSYDNLYNYMLDLYQVPGVAETVKLDHIVTGYYSIARVNPNGIVPKVPRFDWTRPHNRMLLGKALSAA